MPLKTISNWTSHLRNRHFVLIDLVICLISPFIALFIRLDGKIDFAVYGLGLLYATIIFTIVKLAVFYFFELYRRFWQTASVDEMARLIYIGINAFMIEAFIFILLRSIENFPISVLPSSFPFLDAAIAMFMVSSVRFSVRLFERAKELGFSPINKDNKYVIIIGAGTAGTTVVQELQKNSDLGLTPVAFLDDDPEKFKKRIRGIPVIGTTNDLGMILRKYNIPKIIIAMPTASGKKLRKIVEEAHSVGVESLTVPGILEILSGKVGLEKIRPIQIEDLLRRSPIKTDKKRVNEFLQNKRVLITGAGGSIGSELCRQILEAVPSELMLVGHGENSIFQIENELSRLLTQTNSGRNTKISCKIADIRFKSRLRKIFEEYRPDIIFHAAAHKHVPLMELNPSEAITNNIGGTKNLIELAEEFNVHNFVMISTDKAVNPTNVMGATKRVAEMLVLDAAKRTKHNYVVTRFGNVLGSRGSVVRTFREQLLNGGPITLTHPEIKRYFMTIPEAVQLVLQASVLGKGGEIFVFDMGEPVKIMDLAKDMIKLAGMEEGVDIDIKITGLREGEKMYEELFIEGEIYDNTSHQKIMIARNASRLIPDNLTKSVDLILQAVEASDDGKLLKHIKTIVPEFQHSALQSTSNLTIHSVKSSQKSS